ncbi:MAG: PilZ domain-containing protein [Deferrisomatales bacterium]|nr:PilZ domain-containing protein [Deferrisomatales bacterium]
MSGELPKRRYPRVDSENVVLVKRLGKAPLEGFTKTRVLGLGGCMLLSDEPLGVGAELEVLLSFSGRVVQTRGRVVYENPNVSGEYEVGVQFLEIARDDLEFLHRVHPGIA